MNSPEGGVFSAPQESQDQQTEMPEKKGVLRRVASKYNQMMTAGYLGLAGVAEGFFHDKEGKLDKRKVAGVAASGVLAVGGLYVASKSGYDTGVFESGIAKAVTRPAAQRAGEALQGKMEELGPAAERIGAVALMGVHIAAEHLDIPLVSQFTEHLDPGADFLSLAKTGVQNVGHANTGALSNATETMQGVM